MKRRILSTILIFSIILSIISVFCADLYADEIYKQEIANNTIVEFIEAVRDYYETDYYRESQGNLDSWETATFVRAGIDLDKWYANKKYQPIYDMNLKNLASKANQALIMLDIGQNPADFDGRNLIGEIVEEINKEDYGHANQNYLKAVIAVDRFNEKYKEQKVVYDEDIVIKNILAAQTEEGGFKERGESPIPLNTGYALKALSKHKDYDGVNESINKALDYLQSIQKDDGAFYTGTYVTGFNAEVISGLLAVGEDLTSEKWSKGDANPIESLFILWKNNNSFDNKEGESKNNRGWIDATQKALYTLVDLKEAGYSNYVVKTAKISGGQEKPAETGDVFTIIAVDSGEKYEIYSDPKLVTINTKEHNAGLTALGALQATTDLYTAVGGYVEEIFGIEGKGQGGWMYTINDKMPGVNADKAVVKEGDKIVWFYSAQGMNAKIPTWDNLTGTGKDEKPGEDVTEEPDDSKDEIIDIPDGDLKGKLNISLGRYTSNHDITKSELESLTELDADFGDIKDLSGLEYAINLEKLSLSCNQVSNIKPLAGLTKLRHLDLSDNNVSNIEPLAELTDLKHLNLSENQISDIEPLAKLTNLEVLGLNENKISNIDSLVNLTRLSYLSLSVNKVSDIEPLAKLSGLVDLQLGGNQISDISSISKLTNLEDLFLSNNEISNIEPLSELTNLKKLFLSYNEISNIEPLSNLVELSQLELRNNQISDIEPLAGLVKLKNLDLNNNQISNIEPLVNLTNLQRFFGLDLKNNKITEEHWNEVKAQNPQIGSYQEPQILHNPVEAVVERIGILPEVDEITLQDKDEVEAARKAYNDLNQGQKELVTNVDKLIAAESKIAELSKSEEPEPDKPEPDKPEETIEIPDKALEEVLKEALGGTQYITKEALETLTELDASYKNIEDLTCLEYAVNLEKLKLTCNEILDIKPLSKLVNLTHLRLDQNQISDIEPLSELTNLESLDLYKNQISDVGQLANLENLSHLELNKNQLSDIKPLSKLTKLEYLDLEHNQISDVKPLSELNELNHLRLSDNKLTNIEPLSELVKLNHLRLANNKISDIKSLNKLTNLTHLDLDNNLISNIESLAGLLNLKVLSLSYNQEISDISPLANLTSLEELFLSHNKISDIRPLSKLTNLQKIFLTDNQISNIEPLANFTNLDYAFLTNNRITRMHWDKVKAKNPKIGKYELQLPQFIDNVEPDKPEEDPKKQFIIDRIGKEEIRNGQEAKIEIQIQNNEDKTQTAILIVVLYDKNTEEIINYSFIKENFKPKERRNMRAVFLVPSIGRYKIKSFVWDDIEEQNIVLSDPIEIDVKE